MKKKIILITILIILLISCGILYLYIKNKNVPKAEQPKILSFLDFVKDTNNQTPGGSNDKDTPKDQEEIPGETKPEKLIQITSEAVAGFDFIKKPINNAPLSQEDMFTITPITPPYQFTKDILYMTKGGPLGEDIRKLQKTLNLCETTVVAKSGPGSKGRETNEFKDSTKKALIAFQQMTEIEITGNLDRDTRQMINSNWPCKVPKDEAVIPTKTAIIYTKRIDGHIYTSFLDQINNEQISNSTFPTVYESYFFNNGNNVSLGYVSKDEQNTETIIGKIADGIVKPEDTLKNLISVNGSNYSNNLFYLFNFGGNASGTLMSTEGKRDIFSSTFSDWNTETSTNKIILTTKPSSEVLGYTYMIEPSTKTFSKLFGSVMGLTTKISGNGNMMVYSRSKNKSLESSLYDLQTNSSSSLPFKTLAEKCAFGKSEREVYCAVPNDLPSAQYPDDWYKGTTSFTDSIIKYDLSTQEAKTIYTSDKSQNSFDVDIIRVSQEGDYLVFRNKKDYTLWRIDLFVE